jgi:CheY-like chemotaxis protein
LKAKKDDTGQFAVYADKMADPNPLTHDASAEVADLEIKSILLLDDDIDLADTLKSLLETHNYIVTTAKNGVEGLREVMALDFDVIMCDMLMPAMAGDMFYLAVERTKPHLCRRFIFLTGHKDNPKVGEFLTKTKAAVLYKPVTNEELVHTISMVLKKERDRLSSELE